MMLWSFSRAEPMSAVPHHAVCPYLHPQSRQLQVLLRRGFHSGSRRSQLQTNRSESDSGDIQDTSAVFASVTCLGCVSYIDMWQIATSSGRNEYLLITKSSYAKTYFVRQWKFIYIYIKYVWKILTHQNYKNLSKRESLTCKYVAKHV